MKYNKIFRILAIALTLALLVATVPATPVLAAGSFDITPNHGKIGDSIEYYGYGFNPGDSLKIYFSSDDAILGDAINDEVDTYKHIANIAATDGTFIFDYLVPDALTMGTDDEDVTGGTYYIYATLSTSTEIIAVATFTVESPGEITLDTDEGPVGTEVEISGEGFDDEEDLIIEYDDDDDIIDEIVSGELETDDDGEFDFTIVIPESTAGEHTIKVIGDDSGITATAEFTVEPEITLDPTSGPPDTEVTVSGTGFGERSDFEYVEFDGDDIDIESGDDDTDSDGSFEFTFIVIEIDLGTYELEVEDEDGNSDKAEFTIVAVLPATISLEPNTGSVGDTVSINGTGILLAGVSQDAGGGVREQFKQQLRVLIAAVFAPQAPEQPYFYQARLPAQLPYYEVVFLFAQCDFIKRLF